MTINERLFVSDLIKEFDLAVKNKERERVITILKEIRIDENSIKEILKKYNIV